jgi:hypothetical protein
MRRIISLSLLVLTATVGVASADRGRDHRDNGRRQPVAVRQQPVRQQQSFRQQPVRQQPVVREHRDYRQPVRQSVTVRDHRGWDNRNQVRYQPRHVDRRPIYINNGRYSFGGGFYRTYHRPVIQYRYTNYRVRPQILVENYEPVEGYIWVAGQWQWSGYEWNWIDGHYEVDPNYAASGYYDGY